MIKINKILSLFKRTTIHKVKRTSKDLDTYFFLPLIKSNYKIPIQVKK